MKKKAKLSKAALKKIVAAQRERIFAMERELVHQLQSTTALANEVQRLSMKAIAHAGNAERVAEVRRVVCETISEKIYDPKGSRLPKKVADWRRRGDEIADVVIAKLDHMGFFDAT